MKIIDVWREVENEELLRKESAVTTWNESNKPSTTRWKYSTALSTQFRLLSSLPPQVRCPIIQFRLLSSQTITSLLDSKSLQRTTKEYSWWNYSVQQTNLIGCSIGVIWNKQDWPECTIYVDILLLLPRLVTLLLPTYFPSLWLQALRWVAKRGDRISGIEAQSNTHETIVLTT